MFKSTHSLLLAGVNRRAFLKSSAALGLGAVASPAIVSSALSSSGQLSIINWDDELPDPVIPQFEKATGIKVNSTPFSQNEEQINKLQATGGADSTCARRRTIAPFSSRISASCNRSTKRRSISAS